MNEKTTGIQTQPVKKEPSQSDFLSGLVIGGIGVWVLIDSIRMPFYEEGKRGLLSAPGLTPGLLALGLIVMSAMLMFRARGFRPKLERFYLPVESVRVMALLAILVAYVAAIRPLGYVTATFLMLAIFQIAFMRRRTIATVLVWAFGLSAVVTGALYYVFAKVFLIPMP